MNERGLPASLTCCPRRSSGPALPCSPSELNRVFKAILAASDSEFVKALGAFATATDKHLSYVNERVPAIDCSLKDACRVMIDKHGTCPAKS